MRIDKRILPIILLIIAVLYSKDILKGNFKPFLKSMRLLNTFRRLGTFGRGINPRTFTMVNRNINSMKNQKLIQDIVKNHNKKKNNENNKNSQWYNQNEIIFVF